MTEKSTESEPHRSWAYDPREPWYINFLVYIVVGVIGGGVAGVEPRVGASLGLVTGLVMFGIYYIEHS